MAKPELVKIPIEHVETTWPLIKQLVDRGVKHASGRLTTDGVFDRFINGDWQLFVIWDDCEVVAVVGTEIYKTIAEKTVASITFISGRNRKEWIELLTTLEGWAQSAGADIMETWARKGWQRDLKDYKLTHVLLEKDLTNEPRTQQTDN